MALDLEHTTREKRLKRRREAERKESAEALEPPWPYVTISIPAGAFGLDVDTEEAQ